MAYQPGPRDEWAGWDASTRPMAPPPNPQPNPYGAQVRPGRPQPAPAIPGIWPNGSRRPPGSPRPWRRIALIALSAILVVLVILTGLALHRVSDFGQAISTQGPFSTQTGFMSGSDRVNLLVLGYGGGNHDGAYLTDSLMVLSVVPGNSATTMISVPRDLWVQVPPNSGSYAKINAAYQDGFYNGYGGIPKGQVAGGAEAARKVSDVLGMDMPYWLTIDFTGFRELVDSLGGVDMNVPTAFTAQYPRNDDPRVDAGWKIVTFKKGPQHMNGEQAIEYARARYVLQPASEGTDFARSARQQLLIRALLARVHDVKAWPGFLDATNALQKSIYTNLSLTDLTLFTRKMDMNHAARVGLSDQNVLVDAQAGDGESILQPANGDWGAVSRYVASQLNQ